MVKIYSKENCIQCKMTKRFLEAKNIPFEEINVEKDQHALEWLKSQGYQSVPVTITEAASIVGFRPDQLRSLAV